MMNKKDVYTFKIATSEDEYSQIYKLNYETFVEEIPQHAKNDEGILIDKFDSENTYYICLKGKEVVGMVASRSKRPFSLDLKLDNIDAYFPPGSHICELRLLAVKPKDRIGRVFTGLLQNFGENSANFDYAIISARNSQMKLYRRLGFEPFGPPVGSDKAPFQPMFLDRKNFSRHWSAVRAAFRDRI